MSYRNRCFRWHSNMFFNANQFSWNSSFFLFILAWKHLLSFVCWFPFIHSSSLVIVHINTLLIASSASLLLVSLLCFLNEFSPYFVFYCIINYYYYSLVFSWKECMYVNVRTSLLSLSTLIYWASGLLLAIIQYAQRNGILFCRLNTQ